jgi:hypothetical protein
MKPFALPCTLLALFAVVVPEAEAQWSTESLSVPRTSIAAVSAGDLAFFAGGRDGNTVSAAVDIYDAASGAWTAATLSVPRSFLAATAVGGYVLFAGGVGIHQATCTDVVDVSARPNSTGRAATIGADGSASVAANDLDLLAVDLPASAFAYFLTSRAQGFVAAPGGSQGDLCLGGAIGRFVGPGQVQQASASGAISLSLDLTTHPTPTGPVVVPAGETWSFQAWYRDSVAGVATSNFTDGLEVRFRQ